MVAFKRAESIEGFLTRAFLIDKITWTTTQDGMIHSFFMPQHLVNIPAIANKLRYFKYLRTGFKFLFLVNATPYHYGLMKVCWTPAVSRYSTSCAFNATLDSRHSLQAISTMPGVHILGTNSRTYEFTVPYELSSQHVDLETLTDKETDSVIGSIEVWVVNPLRALVDTASSVTISIFAAMDNPILSTPTYKHIDFESITNTNSTIGEFIDTPIPVKGDYQGKTVTSGKGDNSEKQESLDKSSKGVISGILDKISKIAPLLAPVPEIGILAQGVGYAAGIGSQRAALLGYGKPMDVIATQPVITKFPEVATSRGLHTGYRLTLDPSNTKLDLGKVASGEPGEMLLSNIVSIPTFLGRIAYANVVPHQYLIAVKLTPMTSRSKTVTINGNAYQAEANTFASSIARYFKYWRGGIKVEFEFVFSQFHSQRFRIYYVPPTIDHSIPTGNLTANEQANCLSKVISVNGYTRLSVVIPFNSKDYAINLRLQDNLYANDIGYLYLAPISELVTAQGSTSQVYVNTYISATEDSEFFVMVNQPHFKEYVFPLYGTPQGKDLLEGDDSFEGKYTGYQIGSHLTGENVRSIKDLIQRSIRIDASDDFLSINPNEDYVGSHGFHYGYGMGTYLPIFPFANLMYRFRSGGLMINCPQANAAYACMEDALGDSPEHTSMIGAGPPFTYDNAQQGVLVIKGSTEAPLVLKVPYYKNRPYCYNNIKLRLGEVFDNFATTVVNNPAPHELFLSAADDYYLYKLFSPPTLYWTVVTKK
jgi:hypothetical protein